MEAYAGGTATEEELRELTDRLAESAEADAGNFEAYVLKLLKSYPEEKKEEQVDWEALWQRIQAFKETSVQPETAVVKPLRTVVRKGFYWYRAAAILIVLLGAATFWYIYNKRENVKPVARQPVQDVIPGGNKATLTLADGVVIALDSATQGEIAMQGASSVEKLSNGQIVYTADASKSGKVLWNTMTTPRGGQYRLRLPDGTQVWLNAASSITYPVAFKGNTREVKISGEAYFEVAHDEKHPFIVTMLPKENISRGSILVLGTHFNVNAYPEESSVRATLLEGKVQVNTAFGKATLAPGEQALMNNKAPQIFKVNVEQVVAWKNGLFNFNQVSFDEILRQLSRWYDVEIVYNGNVGTKKFAGEIQRDLNLSEILKVLKEASGMQFRIDGKRLIVE